MEAETHGCGISVDVVRVKEEPDWGLEDPEPETDAQVDWSAPEEFKEEPSWDTKSDSFFKSALKATCLSSLYSSRNTSLHTIFQIKAEPTGLDSVDSSYVAGLNTDQITDAALYGSVDSSKVGFDTIKTEPTLENGDSNELAVSCKIKDEPADWSVDSSKGYNVDSRIKNAVTDTVEDPALNDPETNPELKNGTQNQNPVLIQSVSCHICKQSFKNKRQLRRHSKSHAERKETRYKPFYCLICKEEFSQLIKFTAHLQTHTENPYTCEICKKSFTRNSALVKHSILHDREKEHACEFCAERFTFKMELLRHKLSRGCLRLMCGSCENHAFLFNTRHKRINILRR